MIFAFDSAKSALNKVKHGIDFIEAQVLWNSLYVELQATTVGEESRWLVLGKIAGVHYSAIVTYRFDVTRIISVRRSRHEERAFYEKKTGH